MNEIIVNEIKLDITIGQALNMVYEIKPELFKAHVNDCTTITEATEKITKILIKAHHNVKIRAKDWNTDGIKINPSYR